jgi:ATP-binding cassette subfamily B (MDR/TAP) protein 1
MLPLFTILFGDFTNAFGGYFPDCPGIPAFLVQTSDMTSSEFQDMVNGIALKFLYLAIGATVAGFLQQSAWSYTSNRQANRLRRKFLHAVLQQDIAFFDTQATTGESKTVLGGEFLCY